MIKECLCCLTILLDFIEYHWIYQPSQRRPIRMYVVIHTIIELSLLQLIFRISLFVCYCCELIDYNINC